MSFLTGLYNKFMGKKIEKLDLSTYTGFAKLY